MQQRSTNREQWLDRRHFIGGSDARIIMGNDEKALIRLWQEKRGEVGPEDLSANLIVQLGVADRRPQSGLVRAQHRTRHHRGPVEGQAPGDLLDGGHPRRHGDRDRRRL